MLKRALNQKTCSALSFEAFLDLAGQLNCVGVEPRNDLGRPFFDGFSPEQAQTMAKARGLEFLGLSEVYGFNVWDDTRAEEIAALIQVADAAGAATISLIPTVDDRPTRDLRAVMRDILALIDGSNVLPLIEPIGFASSSLPRKAELIDAIEAVGGSGKFKLVHDTFQHVIAGETEVFADYTAMVHISGISDPQVRLDSKQDAHRVLIDQDDRCENIAQIGQFLQQGYAGAFSFECTEPALLNRPGLNLEIGTSFAFLDGHFTA